VAKRKKKRKKPGIKKKSDFITQYNKLLNKLKNISLQDTLTGIYNYQYFIDRLDVELKHAKTYLFPLSVIMVDIDYFKSINDTYGYRAGDRILKEFAQVLKNFIRMSDVIARYGSATFVAILPNTNKEGAFDIAERLCEKIQAYTFSLKRHKIKLKISIGITNFPEDNVNTVAGLLDAADRAMSMAKEDGGNRICALSAPASMKRKPHKGEEKVEDLKLKLERVGKKIDQILLESIYGFAKAIEARDHYTSEHAEEMVSIVRRIAKKMGMSKRDITNLERAAVLHDLGKIGIDDKILRKKGKLTKKEYEEIKKHPAIGAEIIRTVHFLKDVVPLVLHHHERYNGTGYSYGLKRDEIPLGARILAIADVYQALISDRPYRKAYSKREAMRIIKEGAGTQFDPKVVEVFLRSQK
jgi:diguanylate cyclase (GGDEF)-like protein